MLTDTETAIVNESCAEEISEPTKLDILKEMADFVFATKYAKYDEKLKRREIWSESVQRVENMHLKRFSHLAKNELEEIVRAFDLVREKKVVPSLRSLQFGGKAIEAKNQRIFNCSVRHIDSPRAFAEVLYLLLNGSGVGYSVQKHFINRLPNLVNASDKTGTIITYVIEDNIEGWADSVEALLSCYFKNTPYSGRKIVFDYSRIRPEGSPLKTSGGKSPGYKGLKNGHIKIKNLLDKIIEEEGVKRLRPIHVYDILCHCSDMVLSGGQRRSASICIFDKDDKEMLNAKTGNWFETHPHRARSNNSVLLMRDDLDIDEYRYVVYKAKDGGEPGSLFADDKNTIVNPCVSHDTYILTKEYGNVLISSSLVLNKQVHIWNGFEWSKVTPRITGHNQKLWRISLSNGKSLICTALHTWYLADSHKDTLWKSSSKSVKTIELKVGDVVAVGYNSNGLISDNEPVIISAIWEDTVAEEVFCFNEPIKHLGVFNGILTGQCAEINFIPITKDGRSGVQSCNLSEVNGKMLRSEEDFLKAVEAATLIGTLQATYTDFPYLNVASKEITEEEALLGVSITGILENMNLLYNKDLLQRGAKLAVETNKRWSKILGINQAARVTCVKPSGSASLLFQTGCSGIHPAHSHKYFRRVQINKNDNVYKWFSRFNSKMCEESVWSANKTDYVITFPVELKRDTVIKSQLSAPQHLDIIKFFQENWVNPGTTEVNQKPIKHSVSCTVLVKDHEWDQVINYLYENRHYFTAVSLLPANGDKIYQQAPFEAVVTEEDEKKFQYLLDNFKHVDYSLMNEEEDNTELQQELACSGGQCTL